MIKNSLLQFALIVSVLGSTAQSRGTYTVYKPKGDIYKKGWIDFNKNGVKDIFEDKSRTLDERIEDLLSQMTLDEKTCQMVTLYGYKRVLKDDLPTAEWKNQLWKDGMGAIDEHLNGFQQWGLPPSSNEYVWPASKHAWALNEVQRFFIEETRLGIPTDFTNEGIRGVESYIATNFPTQLGLGHTWNRELIGRVGQITGREARLLGYTNVYAPILDVGRDQRWGRYEEVYGESPFLVAELGVAMAKGLQKDYQVASTAKHYIAYSNNKGAREGMSRVDPQMSPREVEMVHVYPFKRVIKEAGILGVMSSYNDYNSEPIQSSKYWLSDRLRGEMGFRGYVVSDSDAVEYLYSKHGTAKDMKEAVKQSVEAGLNVRCTFRSPDSYVLPLRELVDEGSIPIEMINDRVRDILRVKFLIGLFDNPYQTDLAAADREVNSPENQEVSLQASRESIVLLKNADNTLPLNIQNTKRIAVVGPNADEKSFALTHYGPLAVEVTTTLDGIRKACEGLSEVVYTRGCELVDANWPESEIIDFPLTENEKQEIAEAVDNVEKSDVAIVVLGGGVRTCGENKSRSDITLPGRQEELLKALHATGKPIILVLINGRPLAVNWAERNVEAILEAWYPGSQGGTAIADVIFGKYNPSGKLTVTFPKSVGQIPFNFPARPSSQIDGGRTPGAKGNQSRVNGPLYPFGYGLSYTTYGYSDLKLSSQAITANQPITATFKVKNTGKVDGTEIVQLYVRDIVTSIITYEKDLKGFERVPLKAGQEREVSITIQPSELALLNRHNEWVVEEGDFKIMVGPSSVDLPLSATFTVVEPGTVAKMVSGEPTSTNIVASTMQETAEKVVDQNPSSMWSGRQGDYITLPLVQDAKPRSVEVMWGKYERGSEYEIQLSSGGGQFITIQTGAIKGEPNEWVKYTFNETTSSDLRIVIKKGSASIAEVRMKEYRKN